MDKNKINYIVKNFNLIENYIKVFFTKKQILERFNCKSDELDFAIKKCTLKTYKEELNFEQLKNKIQVKETAESLNVLYNTAKKSRESAEYLIENVIIKKEEEQKKIEEEIENIKNSAESIIYFPVGAKNDLVLFEREKEKEEDLKQKKIKELLKKYEFEDEDYYKSLSDIDERDKENALDIKKIVDEWENIQLFISNFLTKKQIIEYLNLDEEIFDYTIYYILSKTIFFENLTYKKVENLLQNDRNAILMNDYMTLVKTGLSNKSAIFFQEKIIKRRQKIKEEQQLKIDREKNGIKKKAVFLPKVYNNDIFNFSEIAVKQQEELEYLIKDLMIKNGDFEENLEREKENNEILQAKKNR